MRPNVFGPPRLIHFILPIFSIFFIIYSYQDQLNSPSNEKQINFDDFDSVGVDIAINGLPFKSTLQGFLASAAANDDQPLFGDELNDFDGSESGNSANGRDKIKIEPLTESVRGQ